MSRHFRQTTKSIFSESIIQKFQKKWMFWKKSYVNKERKIEIDFQLPTKYTNFLSFRGFFIQNTVKFIRYCLHNNCRDSPDILSSTG